MKLYTCSVFVVFAMLNNELMLKAETIPSEIIQVEIVINANINDAWNVLGPEFADIDKWASAVKQSTAKDSQSVNGSRCTARVCKVKGLGTVTEKIMVYSETEHLLSYQVTEGLPKMVKYATCTWQLADDGNGKIRLFTRIEMKTGGLLGGIMKGVVKKKMSNLYKQAAEEFKYYVEKGKPHPGKRKS